MLCVSLAKGEWRGRMYCQEHQRQGGTGLGYESLMSCMWRLKEGEKIEKVLGKHMN